MPELPDLQVFSSNLNRMLAKKEITQVRLMPRAKSNVSGSKLKSTLLKKTVTKVYRKERKCETWFCQRCGSLSTIPYRRYLSQITPLGSLNAVRRN